MKRLKTSRDRGELRQLGFDAARHLCALGGLIVTVLLYDRTGHVFFVPLIVAGALYSAVGQLEERMARQQEAGERRERQPV